jgi:hypothetical protein
MAYGMIYFIEFILRSCGCLLQVGGGGHSMSDLWGLRDYLVENYGIRYCSYDPPGTAWSDPMVQGQNDAKKVR